jgi:hypothetical protein
VTDNPYARLARYKKVERLILEIDRRAWDKGNNPNEPAVALRIVAILGSFTAQQWVELAVGCGQRPPSDKTQALVIQHFVQRATAGQIERTGT